MIVRLLLLVTLLLIMAGCLPYIEDATEANWVCPPLPEGFSESDLVGRWVSEYAAGATDTLVLRGDGTYKQIFSDPIAGYDYVSPWNAWSVEYRSSGGVRLHLTGMRRCDNVAEMCMMEGGGGGDWLWGDFCEGRSMQMKDEVVLLVTGVPPDEGPARRGLWLWHLRPDPDSGSYYFTLREQ